MMGGVGFFSFIMGKFMEIIRSYQEKMGIGERTPELLEWLTELERYTQGVKCPGLPLRASLVE